MAEFESIRQVAARIVADYRRKQMASLEAMLAAVPTSVRVAEDILREPELNDKDREWLGRIGVGV